jgi:hypothetical protein
MATLIPPARTVSGPATDDPRVAGLEVLIARLERTQATNDIGYWAAYEDERGVHHFAYTSDPVYAERSPENALSRVAAIAAFGRALDRYQATLASLLMP